MTDEEYSAMAADRGKSPTGRFDDGWAAGVAWLRGLLKRQRELNEAASHIQKVAAR